MNIDNMVGVHEGIVRDMVAGLREAALAAATD